MNLKDQGIKWMKKRQIGCKFELEEEKQTIPRLESQIEISFNPFKHMLKFILNKNLSIKICYQTSKLYITFSMLILWIIAIYWVVISYFAISTNLKTFRKLEEYSKHKTDPKFQGVVRKDYHSWNRTLIIIGSFTMFPIKFFAHANFLIGALIFALLISFTRGMMKSALIKLMFLYFNVYGKIMNSVSLTIEDDFTDYKITTPIVICNHSCWFDTFYITLRFSPLSFVAKYPIKNWPVIGPIAQAMSCIFVKRESKEGRESVTSLIKERVEQFQKGQNAKFPLVIYPEGTTSNNRCLLTFKNGAFDNLSDVTALCLRYQCNGCLLGEDEIEQIEHIPLMLSQRTKLKVKKLVFSAQEGETVEQYKERIRSSMAEALNVNKVNIGYRDRLELEEFRNEQRRVKVA